MTDDLIVSMVQA